MLLDNLALFLRIVEKGGMATAGRDFGLSPASVSGRLAALEKHYNARLLTRTTRSIHLTDEGRALAEGARRLLEEADDLESRIKLGIETVSGTIRITAPVDIGKTRIAPILTDFRKLHPDVDIDFYLDDGYVDLVSTGIDLGIRYGALADSGLKVKKIAENRRLVCAAPEYVAQYGYPDSPDAIQAHKTILMRFGQNVEREWRFIVNGKIRKFMIKPDCIVNDGELVRQWCKAGHGIVLKSEWDVAEDIKSGALVTLLDDYPVASGALQIVYPVGRSKPRRIRLLIDFIATCFAPDHP